MFDTITMLTKIYIHPENLQHTESFTFQKDGVSRTKYKYKDSLISKIIYRDYNQTLEVELSIPKFLYGNNVNLIKESEIPLFFQRLHQRLHELFNISIRKEDWYTKRLDVCWNFPANEDIDDYLKQLAEMKLPRLKPETYGHQETVVHRNKSRRISFYNKQKECKRTKQPREIIDQAKGLLRMEINLKEKSLSKYSSKRKAFELLTVHFFDYITTPILQQIEFTDVVEGISFQWLAKQTNKISKIESVLGFRVLQNHLTQTELKQLYSNSTYDRKVNLTRSIQFPSCRILAPLKIDYANLG